jgi:hypothetical protein
VSCLQALFPLPYLGCQVAFSVPTRSSNTFAPLVPPPCLSLSAFPSCAYWDPSLACKTCTMVPYDLHALLPHLVCHAPWSEPTLNWLLGAGRGEGACSKLRPHHTHALTPSPQGEEGKLTKHAGTGTPACPTGLPGCNGNAGYIYSNP